MSDLHDGGALARAQERLLQREAASRRLRGHMAAAALLSLLSLGLNLFIGRGRWWFVWPTLAAALSLAVHLWLVHGRGRERPQDDL